MIFCHLSKILKSISQELILIIYYVLSMNIKQKKGEYS